MQADVLEETAKSPLDPMALGLRYAELETIRRELAEELARVRARIREALTEPQRARLRTLDDVLKLLPIYNEAVRVNLVEPFQGFGPFFPGVIGGVIGTTRVPPLPAGAEPEKQAP